MLLLLVLCGCGEICIVKRQWQNGIKNGVDKMDGQLKKDIRSMCATKQIADKMIAKIESDDATKTRCSYPWSEFYTYMEDIPEGTRVSTPEDCKECTCPGDCDDGDLCLIEE